MLKLDNRAKCTAANEQVGATAALFVK